MELLINRGATNFENLTSAFFFYLIYCKWHACSCSILHRQKSSKMSL